MRNVEVLELAQHVNAAAQGEELSEERLLWLRRWSQIGVSERGDTLYRIVDRLVSEVMDLRESKLHDDEIPFGDGEDAGPSQPEPEEKGEYVPPVENGDTIPGAGLIDPPDPESSALDNELAARLY